MNELVRHNSGLMSFTDDQMALIKKQIAPGANADELALFLYVAKKTGLDPLTKQVHCVMRKRKNKNNQWEDFMSIQTAIDGFRVIAERTGLYAGQDEPIYAYVKDSTGQDKLLKATVTVYKFRGTLRYAAAVGVAFWDEYVLMTDEWLEGKKTGNQSPAAMWKKMPHSQLAKCAEALALRKAFPQDLSGIYSNIEMEQADNALESTPELVITETVEELKAKYLLRWQDYCELVGNAKADPIHPSNWKGEQTAKNFVLALDNLEQRINTEVTLQQKEK